MAQLLQFPIAVHQGQRRLWERWIATTPPPDNDDGDPMAESYGTSRIFVAEVSARWGKSAFAVSMCLLAGCQIPHGFIRYAAATQKMVQTIVTPLIRERIESMPEWARPKYDRTRGCWVFPTTHAELWIAGCDSGNAEHLRGVSTHLFVVDEAGFVDDLDYVVRSILLPRTITTNGRGLVISTPPKSPAHPFVFVAEDARKRGAYYHGTIHEADHIPARRIVEFCREAGGPRADAWRREYLAERVIDSTLAVVPEFIEHEPFVVEERERPAYFDRYVSLDPGFQDLSAAVLAYYDFPAGKLVVEDELSLERANTAQLAEELKRKEAARWPGEAPLLRVADVDPRLLADLHQFHGLTFVATQKDDKDAALNALRLAIQNHTIAIHPRCVNTIAHLRTAIWNKQRTGFERATGFGHFDFVDALVYLLRNVDKQKNPFPALWHGESHATHWIPERARVTEEHRQLRAAFAGRLRRTG